MTKWHKDDDYIEYANLVEAGEINPKEVSVEDYVADKMAERIDRAHDEEKDRRLGL